jgi:hypothetical protein
LINISSQINLQQVQSFKKQNLRQMYASGNYLIVITDSSMDLHEFKEAERFRKLKCDIPSMIKQIIMSNSHIYTYSVDSKVRQYALQDITLTRELFARDGI